MVIFLKMEIIKPGKDRGGEKKSVITPILYLLLGIILAFKNNEAVTIVFYLIGIIVLVYGIKALIEYYKYKELVQYKKINLSVGISSIIAGILLVVLAEVIEKGIRYVLGFFLIFFGITRIMTQVSYGKYFTTSLIMNIALIILGVFSIFVSNVILVFAGWVLMANALLLFIDYFRN